MAPFFSVIMPVYNVEGYLTGSVNTVLAQDDQDFELILVDDGSRDGSSQLCDEIAARHTCVHVIHKPNGGLASARNAGIEAARGEYIIMPDSDDRIEPDTLSSVRRAVAEAAEGGIPGLDMVHYDMMVHANNQSRPQISDVPAGLYAGEQIRELQDAAMLYRDKYVLSACTCAYRKGFLAENGLRFISEREVLSEDFLFNVCALMVAKSVWMIDRPLYHYDNRAGSLTDSAKPQMVEQYTRLYQEAKAYMASHAPDAGVEDKLATFYVLKLLYCNYIHGEYTGRNGSTWEEGRDNVRAILRKREVRAAAKRIDLTRTTTKDRVRAICIRLGLEAPLAFSYRNMH